MGGRGVGAVGGGGGGDGSVIPAFCSESDLRNSERSRKKTNLTPSSRHSTGNYFQLKASALRELASCGYK